MKATIDYDSNAEEATLTLTDDLGDDYDSRPYPATDLADAVHKAWACLDGDTITDGVLL